MRLLLVFLTPSLVDSSLSLLPQPLRAPLNRESSNSFFPTHQASLSFPSPSYSTISVVKEIERLNEAELRSGTGKSWHDVYKDSAYIFIGSFFLTLPVLLVFFFSHVYLSLSSFFLCVTPTAATHADAAQKLDFSSICNFPLCLVSSFVVLIRHSLSPLSSFRLSSPGNLDHRLTEGDIRTVFSQFGEPTDLNLVRDKVSAVDAVSHARWKTFGILFSSLYLTLEVSPIGNWKEQRVLLSCI